MSKIEFDNRKEYGIVLEGGGAKGAYQIGVWKALLEHQVKIKGVSGVSVGALNGALICMNEYKTAEKLWNGISYSAVIDVDDEKMHNIMQKNLKELDLRSIREDGIRIISEGGFDTEPLKQLIDSAIDEDKIRNSNIEFILSTFSLTELKEVEKPINEIEEGKITDYLMASSAFPLFKSKRLNGKVYVDGGFGNNIPIDCLIKRGYKDIIIIRIYGMGIERRIKVPEDVNVIEIAPDINLGGILEFDKKKAKRNIIAGYFDGLRVVASLEGKYYFIEKLDFSEYDYFEQLINVDDNLLDGLKIFYNIYNDNKSKIRILVEDIYPKIAIGLKLDKNWNYKDLYFAIIETCARKLRIKRYNLYSLEEFIQLLGKGIEKKYDMNEFNVVVELSRHIIKLKNT